MKKLFIDDRKRFDRYKREIVRFKIEMKLPTRAVPTKRAHNLSESPLADLGDGSVKSGKTEPFSHSFSFPRTNRKVARLALRLKNSSDLTPHSSSFLSDRILRALRYWRYTHLPINAWLSDRSVTPSSHQPLIQLIKVVKAVASPLCLLELLRCPTRARPYHRQ